MVRTYKPKTTRSTISEVDMKDAVKAVLLKQMSQRAACITFGIKRSTLQHRINKKLKKQNLNVVNEDSGLYSISYNDDLPKKPIGKSFFLSKKICLLHTLKKLQPFNMA